MILFRSSVVGLVLRREDRLPIIFHVDDNPTFGVRLVERFIEAAHGGLAIVGILARGVCVVDE